jgi:hypothetical protein
MAAPARSSRSWPTSWAKPAVGDDDDQDHELAAIIVRVYRPSWTRPADNGVARIPLACDLLGDRTIARLEVLMIVTVLSKVAVGAWTREPAAR